MTPEEIVATKLLGWERGVEDDGQVVYLHKESGSVHYFGGELDGCGMGQINGADFPDLSNWNDIRRMEDALAKKGLSAKYYSTITASVEFNALESFADNAAKLLSALSQATPEQRVQAALRVIEAAGL